MLQRKWSINIFSVVTAQHDNDSKCTCIKLAQRQQSQCFTLACNKSGLQLSGKISVQNLKTTFKISRVSDLFQRMEQTYRTKFVVD